MKRVFLLISSLMVMGVALSGQAQAAHLSGFCADHDEAVKRLQQRYGERQIAVGLTSGGTILEVLATRTGSSWSVLITNPNGRSCLVVFGSDLTALPVPTDTEPNDYPEM